MILFPAIDLFDGKAVRLYKGDYAQMTVYSDHPASIARDFVACGATHIHIVDLEGAKDGTTPNLETVCAIKEAAGAFCEIGGGIRSMEVVRRYLDAGLDRVILGTAAVTDRAFLREAVAEFGETIAVGVDLKGGFVAVRGWTETTELTADAFCADSVIATAEYGPELTAAVQKDKVYGCQFHPEKSGAVGLGILKAFCEVEA